MMEYEDMDDVTNVEAEILGLVGVSRHGTYDPTAWLTDADYAAGNWHRISYEANTFGPRQDSRITDQSEERADQTGARFYTPIWVLEPITEDRRPENFGQPLRWSADEVKSKRMEEDMVGQHKRDDHGVLIRQGMQKVNLFEEAVDKRWKELIDELVDRTPEKEDKLYTQAYQEVREKRLGLKEVRYWVLTPMNLDSLQQAPRLPFFMVPKWQLNKVLMRELVLKRERPDQLVSYMYVGCENDGELIRFIRTDDGLRTPPVPLVRSGEGYSIPRQFEDERGITMRVKKMVAYGYYYDSATPGGSEERHFGYITARQVRKGEEELKRRTRYYEGYTSGYDSAGYSTSGEKKYPLQFPEGTAEEERSDRLALEYLDELVENGTLEPEDAVRLIGAWRDYYEYWFDREYDWWLPSEFHSFRHQFYDRLSWYGPTAASKADRIWGVMNLIVDVWSQPRVVNLETRELDWTGFDAGVYMSPIETRRDIVRLYNQWKMSKSTKNTEAAGDIEISDIKRARSLDWGGPRNPDKALYHWRFMVLYQLVQNARPATSEVSKPRVADTDANRAVWDAYRASKATWDAWRTYRLRMMGNLWKDKRPEEHLDHYGALVSRFGAKWENWIKGIKTIRSLTTMVQNGTFYTWDNLSTKVLDELRADKNEYEWLMDKDEYILLDPYDTWRNQKGIVISSLVHEANSRIDGAFDHLEPWEREEAGMRTTQWGKSWEDPHPYLSEAERRSIGLRLSYDNCTNLRTFVKVMWRNLNADPIARNMQLRIDEWKHANELHIRKEINKILHGVHLTPGLEKYLEQWYWDSDERVWDFVYWFEESMSTEEGSSGAWGFGIHEAVNLCEEGFGTGYGTLAEQQSRQERLMDIGLFTGYYQEIKRICSWFSVRVTAIRALPDINIGNEIAPDKSWPTINELKMDVASTIKSGKLLHYVAEKMLWPRLQQIAPDILNEPFPLAQEVAKEVDDDFVEEVLLPLSGNLETPKLEVARTDPDLMRRRNHRLHEESERYKRIVEGRFFEINHSH